MSLQLWNTFHRTDLVAPGIKQTLSALGLDYLDLYLIHWPMAYKVTDEYNRHLSLSRLIMLRLLAWMLLRLEVFWGARLWFLTFWRIALSSSWCILSLWKTLNLQNSFILLPWNCWNVASFKRVWLQEDGPLFPEENGKTQYSEADYLDTWKEMEKLVDQGLTKSIGVSNFNSQQLERVLSNARIKPVTNQVRSRCQNNC